MLCLYSIFHWLTAVWVPVLSACWDSFYLARCPLSSVAKLKGHFSVLILCSVSVAPECANHFCLLETLSFLAFTSLPNPCFLRLTDLGFHRPTWPLQVYLTLVSYLSLVSLLWLLLLSDIFILLCMIIEYWSSPWVQLSLLSVLSLLSSCVFPSIPTVLKRFHYMLMIPKVEFPLLTSPANSGSRDLPDTARHLPQYSSDCCLPVFFLSTSGTCLYSCLDWEIILDSFLYFHQVQPHPARSMGICITLTVPHLNSSHSSTGLHLSYQTAGPA